MSSNGYLASSELTTVQTGSYLGAAYVIQLANIAASAFLAAKAASGNVLTVAAPDGGYRSFAVQAEIRSDYLSGNYSRHNLDPNSTATPAAAGTSKHGLGLCVDLGSSSQDVWMSNNGGAYGFSHPLPGDPHHWQHDGVTSGASPTSPTNEEQELYYINNTATTGAFPGYMGTIGVKFMQNFGSAGDAAFAAGKLPKLVATSEAEFHVLTNSFGIPWASVPVGGSSYYAG